MPPDAPFASNIFGAVRGKLRSSLGIRGERDGPLHLRDPREGRVWTPGVAEWLLPGSAGLSLHRQRDPAQVTGVEVVQLAWEVVSR